MGRGDFSRPFLNVAQVFRPARYRSAQTCLTYLECISLLMREDKTG